MTNTQPPKGAASRPTQSRHDLPGRITPHPPQDFAKHSDGSITLGNRRAYACLSAAWEISQLCHLMASLPTGTEAEGNLTGRGLTARIVSLNDAIIGGLDDADESIEDIERAVFLRLRGDLKPV